MIPDFVCEAMVLVRRGNTAEALRWNNPGSIIFVTPDDEVECISVKHDRSMYDYIAGMISED